MMLCDPSAHTGLYRYLVLTQQIYSEETKGAHAHNRDRVPLMWLVLLAVNKLQYRMIPNFRICACREILQCDN